jgi:hypothetical protein
VLSSRDMISQSSIDTICLKSEPRFCSFDLNLVALFQLDENPRSNSTLVGGTVFKNLYAIRRFGPQTSS